MADPFRKNHYIPTNEQKAQALQIKTDAEALLAHMDEYVPIFERSDRARCMNTGRTFLESAIMWAVKAVTTPPAPHVVEKK